MRQLNGPSVYVGDGGGGGGAPNRLQDTISWSIVQAVEPLFNSATTPLYYVVSRAWVQHWWRQLHHLFPLKQRILVTSLKLFQVLILFSIVEVIWKTTINISLNTCIAYISIRDEKYNEESQQRILIYKYFEFLLLQVSQLFFVNFI